MLAAVLDDALDAAGVTGVVPGRVAARRVEAVRRGPALFLLNHGAEARDVTVDGAHDDLLSGNRIDGDFTLAPHSAAVLVTAG